VCSNKKALNQATELFLKVHGSRDENLRISSAPFLSPSTMGIQKWEPSGVNGVGHDLRLLHTSLCAFGLHLNIVTCLLSKRSNVHDGAIKLTPTVWRHRVLHKVGSIGPQARFFTLTCT